MAKSGGQSFNVRRSSLDHSSNSVALLRLRGDVCDSFLAATISMMISSEPEACRVSATARMLVM
jgi:hypothetical protein